jgi:hypothetical protein
MRPHGLDSAGPNAQPVGIPASVIQDWSIAMTSSRTAILAAILMSAGMVGGPHDADAWDRNGSVGGSYGGGSSGGGQGSAQSGGCTGGTCGNGGTYGGSGMSGGTNGYPLYQQGGVGVYVTPGNMWPSGGPNGPNGQTSNGGVSSTCVDNVCNRPAIGPQGEVSSRSCVDNLCTDGGAGSQSGSSVH